MHKKILVAGKFSLLHPGHYFFLKEAKSLGSELVVVLTNDKNIPKDKKLLSADKRKKILESLDFVDKVIIGDSKDKLKVVKEEKPDIIALGFNQEIDEEKLRMDLKSICSDAKVVRIKKHLAGYSTTSILKRLNSPKSF